MLGDLDLQSFNFFDIFYKTPPVALVRKDLPEPGIHLADVPRNDLSASIPVLNVGGVNDDVEDQPADVDEEVALPSVNLLAPVVPSRPPFSVVLTD